MDTKLSQVLKALAANDFKKAISLAAKFPRLGNERNAILDAHMAFTNPRFASQLGKDLEQLKLNGIAALRAKYIRETII